MAFLIFERVAKNDLVTFRPTGDNFRLAGYNLIYMAWENHGRPMNHGWHVTADELIKIHTNNKHSDKTRTLVIDFDPKAKWRIGLVELLDAYAYTYGEDSGEPVWTPLMLRMRDLYYEEYEREITEEQKQSILSSITEPTRDSDFIEFLYLNGSKKGWNWGKNGMTNAVFIQDEARDYFRSFF